MGCVFNVPGIDCRLEISNVNIFEQEGVKIIHGPRTFDTHPDIVPPQTVYGQLIKICEEKNAALDMQIDHWCNAITQKGEAHQEYPHRKIRFHEGELCPIMVDNDVYCIAAFSDTENIFVADNIVLGQYISYWHNIWRNLLTLSLDKSIVNVAVPGSRLVSIGPSSFGFEQNIAIILYTYFKSIADSNHCKTLRVCLFGKSAAGFDYTGWETHIMPFLFAQSILPIEWTPSRKPSNRKEMGLTLDESAQKCFVDDFLQIIENLVGFNGMDFMQYEGSKRITVKVDVDEAGLKGVLNAIKSSPAVSIYLTRRKGTKYDRNHMFQLIGILQESSTLFGELNRRSVVYMSIGSEDVVPERWIHLGNDVSNIINYVGQKLADIKKNNQSMYNKILQLIPEDKRKK